MHIDDYIWTNRSLSIKMILEWASWNSRTSCIYCLCTWWCYVPLSHSTWLVVIHPSFAILFSSVIVKLHYVINIERVVGIVRVKMKLNKIVGAKYFSSNRWYQIFCKLRHTCAHGLSIFIFSVFLKSVS